jgi:flagellar biosynthesis/type III secretory pathway protein FliH
MILFDFATPAEKARVKVMLRPEDSPLFSPTRHGPAFSPQFDADEPIRRHRFARGIPQGDDGAEADSDVDLLERDGSEEQASAQGDQAVLADDAQAQDGNTNQDGLTPDSLVAEDASVEDEASVAEGDEAVGTAAEASSEPNAAVTDPALVDDANADTTGADAAGGDAATQAATTDAPTDQASANTDANPDATEASNLSESASADESSDTSAPPVSQDLSDADDSLDASTEELVKQAYEAGYAAAKAELGEGTEASGPEAEDAAYLRGLEEGQRQTKDELEAEVLLAADDLKALVNQLAQAARDTETFYQPLLKLSMHLAEQLVRGELSLSGQAITRLVERCLSEFQQETSAPIVVRMNPADHERHLAYGAMAPKNMDLRPDPSLSSGSVKVSMNGAMIEDLIEHRRQALWDALMSAAATPDDDLPDSFLRNVAIVKEAMASVDDEGTQPPAL